MGTGNTARNGPPEKVWQSAQWQAMTLVESTKAVKEMAPQWQWPVICIGIPQD
jgi:hypothetical protein